MYSKRFLSSSDGAGSDGVIADSVTSHLASKIAHSKLQTSIGQLIRALKIAVAGKIRT